MKQIMRIYGFNVLISCSDLVYRAEALDCPIIVSESDTLAGVIRDIRQNLVVLLNEDKEDEHAGLCGL